MSVDLSSTCLFTFSANTRHSHVNCIFLFRHTDTEIKFPFASFHFISLVHIVSVFFAPPTFLCSHILNAWNSILYYVSHCWSRCDFKLYLWRRILLSLRSLLGASSLCFAALLIGFQDHLNSKGHIKSIFFFTVKKWHLNWLKRTIWILRELHTQPKRQRPKWKSSTRRSEKKKHGLAREKCAHKYICNDKTIRWKYNAKPLYLNNFRVHFSPVGLFSAIYFVIVAF